MTRKFVNRIRAGALAGSLLAVVQSAPAADVSQFYIRKGMLLEQSSATLITTNAFMPATFIARADGKVNSISSVSLSTPSPFFSQFELDFLGNRFEYTIPGTVDDVNTYFPNTGTYTFTFDSDNDGLSFATLSYPSSPFPAAVPQILNYAAAQNINAAASFSLNFSPFSGAAANDYYELEIFDGSGEIVFFRTGSASTTSVSIPAGTFNTDESFDGHLRFVHDVTTDTTSYPGARGSAGYFKETQFNLSTGTGGGGNDTTPPALIFSNPANGAVNVAVNLPITFAFNEPMTPQQTIQWSANVNAANFSYAWLPGNQALNATYTGGLPGNATITWNLIGGPTGFRDVAGNALPAGSQGSFTTASGGGSTNNPCGGTNAPGAGGGVLLKTLEFVQTGNTAPVLKAESPANAFATYNAATNQTVTKVTVTGPNNVNITLSNLFGSYIGFQDFPSAAALDAAFPSGTYTITATGAGAASLFLTNVSSLPTPRISNLTELGAIDPTKDFVLQFSPFTSAGPSDTIYISIAADDGREFDAPDYCLNRTLTNTATSIVIPANTFQSVQKLTGHIAFSRGSYNTNGIPNTYLSAAASVQTSFELTASSGSQVRWTSATVNANGIASFGIRGPDGANLLVEGTSNFVNWAQVATLTTTNGVGAFSTNTKTNRNSAFRARPQ